MPNGTSSNSLANAPTSRPSRVIATQETFSGPLLPPQVLGEYDCIVPVAAERIIALAESQSKHRQDLESRVIRSDMANSRLGLVFGLLIGMGGLCAATVTSVFGHPVTGGTIGVAVIGSMVATFVYGSQSRRAERASRRHAAAKHDVHAKGQ